MDVALVSAVPVVAPTKLHVPDGGGALVPRDGAIPDARVALVAAPRATVAAWARAAGAAWVSLDPEDADPVRLWRCVIGAFRALQPGFGADAEAILSAGPAALGDAVIPLVAAEVAATWAPPPPLALDGADVLGERAEALGPSLARWLACAPAGARLVVAASDAGALAPLAAALDADVTTVSAPSSARPRTAATPNAIFDAALTARQPAVAAAVVAGAWPVTLLRGERDTVLAWLRELPPAAAAAEADLWLVRLWAALERGALAQADRQLATTTIDHVAPSVLARGHLVHAADALRRGDLDLAADRIDAAARHDPAEGYWHTLEALLRGHEAFWRGHPRVAHRHFARAAGLAHVHGDRYAQTAALGALALLATEGGDDENARRRLGRLEDLRDADPAVGEHPVAVPGALAEGRMLELAGAYEAAVAPLRRAITLADRGASRFERAEPRLRLAAVHRACQRSEDAEPLEREALVILGGCPDRGRLAGLAAAVAPTAPRRDALSPSERAVLRLLPSGLSQREIGAELFLSVNTVKTHCRNIYTKLHAASREQAVARAHEQGLL